jgi:HD superfamily phosphohydrolase
MRNTESLFVRGLLHDIGHLVLFSHYPDACREALSRADEGLEARLFAEHEAIGVDAMEFAAELSRVWQLPTAFTATFEHLMRPEDVAGPLAREIALLHIGVQFSHGVDSDMLITDVIERIRPPVWRLAELPPDVGAAALDSSTMDLVDAMYKLLTSEEAAMTD